jgi:hypothetical protein
MSLRADQLLQASGAQKNVLQPTQCGFHARMTLGLVLLIEVFGDWRAMIGLHMKNSTGYYAAFECAVYPP